MNTGKDDLTVQEGGLMEEKLIQPWISVNGLMNDEYKDLVIELAWKQFPQASPELKKFTRSIFNSSSTYGVFVQCSRHLRKWHCTVLRINLRTIPW